MAAEQAERRRRASIAAFILSAVAVLALVLSFASTGAPERRRQLGLTDPKSVALRIARPRYNGTLSMSEVDMRRPQHPLSSHIVYAAGKEHLVGVYASMHSILENTRTPEAITFHLFQLSNANADFEENFDEVQRYVESKGARFEVHGYLLSDVEPFINSHFGDGKVRGNLQDPSNYVRFILVKVLPYEFCLWIDADTIVQDDIVPFMNERDASKGVAAFSRTTVDISSAVRAILKEKGVDLSPAKPTFNAGIIVLNLKLWREVNAYDQVVTICALNKKLKLWTKNGSQPPLQLLFSGDRFEHLAPTLYADGLGWKSGAIPGNRMFLHWNGKYKPWLAKGFHKKYWQKYAP